MNKSIYLSLTLIVFSFGNMAVRAEESRRPNIMVILVDDLGYGDLSSYGAKDLKSPHVDQLMADGFRFNNFYANCPVCSPTRASLLTGRYPELVGVPGVVRTHPENNWGYLDPAATLLPKMLKQAGYYTSIIGKWHLGLESPNVPNDRGFDHFHGYLGDMMDDYYKHRRHGINYMRLNDKEIDPEGHATDLFTEWACDYLESRKDTEQPFFMYLAYNAPHTPIQPPQDWIEIVKERETGITDFRAKLVALVEHMDQGIGTVMAKLKETGQYENTLTIFVSDNGGQETAGADNGPLRDEKQSMYEGGIRVPMCAVWPGKIKPGSLSTDRGITMDIFPTACEAAGVSVDHEIEGISILNYLTGKQAKLPNRDLFFHRREGGNRYGGQTINALIHEDWKLLQNSPWAPLELYDLKNDPQETTDLAKKAPKVFNELSALLRVQIQRGGAIPWQKPERQYAE
ncbi:MAG: sulfatase-like hydrolase/transferase [Pirellulales bacterium]